MRFGFYLLAATYIAVTCTILFACGLPFEKNWQIHPDPGNSCQTTVSIVNYLVTVSLNITTDIYLMAIPVSMLLYARLRTAKKLGLCLLFSGGIFVGTAAILRCILALAASSPASFYSTPNADDLGLTIQGFRTPQTMPTRRPRGRSGRASSPSW